MMKKHLLAALFLTLLICCAFASAEECSHPNLTDDVYMRDDTYHWLECPDCHAQFSVGTHYVSCTNPGFCAVCGIGYSLTPQHNCDMIQYNESYHWYECLDCTQTIGLSEHHVKCTNPGVCAECGAECSAEPQHNVDWENYKYDENDHWYECLDCSQTFEYSGHYVKCSNPGVCAYCGAECSAEPMHNCDLENMQYDENCHWYICLDCSQALYPSDHYVLCSNPGVCSECGAECSAEPQHNVDWGNYEYDEDSHWYECLDCSQKVYPSEHYAMCSNPGVCAECGAECSDEPQHNYDVESMQYDENCHWYICLDCNQAVYPSEHYARCSNPGVCAVCGAECSDEPMHNCNDENM